jgi:hypothetical protein
VIDHAGRAATPAAAPKAEVSPAGCPACGSDGYSTEPGADGQPDENGIKSCEECGEQWV